MTPREELIEIQKRIVTHLEADISRCVTDDSPMMRRYRQEYEREIQKYSRTATQRELVQKVMEADVVFCGDYHTLSLAQRTPLRLLHQAVHRGRKVIIAMEMAYAKHQDVLDQYVYYGVTTQWYTLFDSDTDLEAIIVLC